MAPSFGRKPHFFRFGSIFITRWRLQRVRKGKKSVDGVIALFAVTYEKSKSAGQRGAKYRSEFDFSPVIQWSLH